MKVTLAYGKGGLEVDLPETGVEIIEPRFVEGLADEAASLLQALRHPVASAPLRELATAESSVAIIFPDRTRAMPSDRVLPIVLSELDQVPKENITLINAVGTHRSNTPQELEAMLGREILSNYRIVQHQPRERSSMVHLGASRFGNQVWVNKDFVQARLKILTGFIEPHFFAGFSGGPKAVLLGVGAFESILRNHSAPMIDDPNSTWGETANNPIYREMSEIAALVEPDFIVNVTLNRNREITGVFAGDWKEAHVQGVPVCQGIGHAVRGGTLRYRSDHQFGVPLGSESLPGRQGHVGSLPHRQAGWNHHHGFGVLRRRAVRGKLRPLAAIRELSGSSCFPTFTITPRPSRTNGRFRSWPRFS